MKTDRVQSFVLLILLLQAASTGALWVLNVLSVESTSVFEILLAANLVAFAIVVQAYRNPDSVAGVSDEKKEAAQKVSPTSGQPASETVHASGPSAPALSPLVHISVPILSALVLLAFAVTLFLPSDKSPIPPTSTQLFIPIYLLIVVVFVFGSIYLFKRLLDTESPAVSH